jgi:hypothetical protein
MRELNISVMPGHGPSNAGVNALTFRASTPCFPGIPKEDVDGRNKSGHDGVP